MTTYEAAALALSGLTDTGAGMCSARARVSEKREFTVDSGRFSLLRTTFDKGLDLTLIKDHRRGKVAGNDLSGEGIKKAVQDCLLSAQSASPDEAWQLYPGTQERFNQGAPEGNTERLFQRTRELLDTIKQEYPKVMVEQMIVSHDRVESVYLNNLGADYRTLAGDYGLFITVSGHEGDKTSSFNFTGFATDSLEKPFIELADLRQTLEDIGRQIDTVAPEGKYEGTVVFTPGCAADILESLVSTFAGDGGLLDGTSPWKDKLGARVADQRLTLRIAPHDPAVVCGERYLDDGRLSQDYDLIKDGVLQQFMLSSYVANKIGLPPAPSASFSVIMPAGDQSLADILRGIDRGLLVSRFSGGSPASNGDFSGVAKNSFLIEKGQVGSAVSETMISGNLGDMLNHLRGISREAVQDGWRVLPWIAVDGIVISGK